MITLLILYLQPLQAALFSKVYWLSVSLFTKVNSVPVENRPAHNYLLLGISMTYLIYFKNDDCACQKSFAIRTDGVSFEIILACFALAAI